MRPLAVDAPEIASGLIAIPLRTRLVVPGDDLISLVHDAIAGTVRPGDTIVIAETAVAIAQGRFVAAEYVRPSKLAFVLSRRAGALATINQPESLQLVIDAVGPWRVIGAALAHIGGRLIGRRGVFYEILGEAIATIDGYTGTLAPYERAIVLGPAEPDAVCETIAAALGVGCAIVDANDLHRAKTLGASAALDRDAVAVALRENPHGNGDEQTPIVVLKWRGDGRNPLLR